MQKERKEMEWQGMKTKKIVHQEDELFGEGSKKTSKGVRPAVGSQQEIKIIGYEAAAQTGEISRYYGKKSGQHYKSVSWPGRSGFHLGILSQNQEGRKVHFCD